MGIPRAYPSGAFCWVDLGTTDVDGAKRFYGELFGWDIVDVPAGPDGTYSIARLRGRAVTGIHSHGADEGVGWSSSVRVMDAVGTAGRAREQGGDVRVEASEIPGTAVVAAITDPAGAEVVLWEPRGFDGAEVVNEPGAWTWNELTTPDLEAAASFYGKLFGWSLEEVAGPLRRGAFVLGDLLIGGAHEPAPGEPPDARWTVAFWVEDADATMARATELGASVLLPPTDVPVGRFAILADPAGAAFTVTAVPGGPVRSLDAT